LLVLDKLLQLLVLADLLSNVALLYFEEPFILAGLLFEQNQGGLRLLLLEKGLTGLLDCLLDSSLFSGQLLLKLNLNSMVTRERRNILLDCVVFL